MTAHHAWTETEDAVLGTAFDSVVAARLGVTVAAVRNRRKSCGIAEFVPPTSPPGTTLLPNGDQSSVPGKLRRYPVWPPKVVALFGQVTDREIARVMGCSPITVSRMRRHLQVPPIYSATKKAWDADHDEVVKANSIPDAAKLLGVSVQSVTRRRRALGLPTNGKPVVDREVARRMRCEGNTISDIARAIDVSRATVRRAIQGK